MGIEKKIVAQKIMEVELENYLRSIFEKAEYSSLKIEKTPVLTRIIVNVGKPAIAIAKLRKKEEEIKETLIKQYNILNPQIVIEEVKNPYLDARIIAYRIKRAIEKGINFKKASLFYIERCMENGAIGIEVRVAGKLLGKERSAAYKFSKGYILHTGFLKEVYVDEAQAQAVIPVGIVGIKVRILKQLPQLISPKTQ
ncbi:MAG: 30S ribosomal protein S3 [Candidatus Aenigmatarchaeota archaeon]